MIMLLQIAASQLDNSWITCILCDEKVGVNILRDPCISLIQGQKVFSLGHLESLVYTTLSQRRISFFGCELKTVVSQSVAP
jgi:hypothetical protein